MGEILIRKPGLYTTVQDGGRLGYQSVGIPVSGAMDRYAYRISNYLLENDSGEAVLEATLLGPEIEFKVNTAIALTGGDLSPKLNGESIDMWRSVNVESGDTLSFGEVKSGARTYIAFSGGIDIPCVMGSRATYTRGNIGGYRGRKLETGDLLKIGDCNLGKPEISERALSPRYIPSYSKEIELRVVLGPQDEKFTVRGMDNFLGSEFKCTPKNDRMGYRLSGEPVETISGSDIVSDGIAFGAVQITNSGDPIIMMADRQTVGGYAKIGCVISSDLPKVAQAKTGDKMKFKSVSVEKAQDILRKYYKA